MESIITLLGVSIIAIIILSIFQSKRISWVEKQLISNYKTLSKKIEHPFILDNFDKHFKALEKYLKIEFDEKTNEYVKSINKGTIQMEIEVDTKQFRKSLKKMKREIEDINKLRAQYLGEEQSGTINLKDVEKNNPHIK